MSDEELNLEFGEIPIEDDDAQTDEAEEKREEEGNDQISEQNQDIKPIIINNVVQPVGSVDSTGQNKARQQLPKQAASQLGNHGCSFCGANFGSVPQLEQHVHTHLWTSEENASQHVFSTDSGSRSGSTSRSASRLGSGSVPSTSRDPKAILCQFCDEELSDVNNLYRHCINSHIKVFVCSICNILIQSKKQVWVHMQRHIHRDDLVCLYCTTDLPSLTKLHLHMSEHTSERHRCVLCAKVFITLEHLKKHMKVHGDSFLLHHMESDYSKAKGISCALCAKIFMNETFLVKHMESKHPGFSKKKTAPKQAAPKGKTSTREQGSTDASSQKKSTIEGFREHVKLMVDGQSSFMSTEYQRLLQPYGCYRCGRSFPSGELLGAHLRTAPNCNEFLKEPNPPDFILRCHLCPYECHEIGSLSHHIRHVHSDGHKETDQGTPQDLPTSTKKPSKSNKTLVYQCKHCSMAFTNLQAYVQHLKTVHTKEAVEILGIKNENPDQKASDVKRSPIIKCDYCEKLFLMEQNYKVHMKDKHGLCIEDEHCREKMLNRQTPKIENHVKKLEISLQVSNTINNDRARKTKGTVSPLTPQAKLNGSSEGSTPHFVLVPLPASKSDTNLQGSVVSPGNQERVYMRLPQSGSLLASEIRSAINKAGLERRVNVQSNVRGTQTFSIKAYQEELTRKPELPSPSSPEKRKLTEDLTSEISTKQMRIHVPNASGLKQESTLGGNEGDEERDLSGDDEDMKYSQDDTVVNLYTCSKCKMMFSSAHLLKRHRYTCHPTVVRCEKCPSSFLSGAELMQHDERFHTQHICGYCKRAVIIWSELKQHIFACKNPSETKLEKDTLHPCEECYLSYRSTRDLDKHQVFKHGHHTIYVCDQCRKVFNSTDALEKHVKNQHGRKGNIKPKKEEYTCTICKDLFRTYSAYVEHILTHETAYICCRLCRERFKSKNSLILHMPSHLSDEIYSCALCQVRFSSHVDINYHISAHRPQQVIVCKVCCMVYPNQQLYQLHMKSHEAETIMMCEHCKEVFKTLPGLLSHKVRHFMGGLDFYKCTNCTSVFLFESELKRHMVEEHHLWSDKSNFRVCFTCHRACPNEKAYEKHMQTHRLESPSPAPVRKRCSDCVYCIRGFCTEKELKDHKSSHH